MVNIHGKQYITVAERIKEAGEDFVALNTEVLSHDPVVIKATVTTKKGTFTGISYANISKLIEKASPYEVAETSAVGRALGFAGYGIVEGIATADEIVKADTDPDWIKKPEETILGRKCAIHNIPLLRGLSKTKTTKEGKPLPYWYHPIANGELCFGNKV